jgi:hypothetical protein
MNNVSTPMPHSRAPSFDVLPHLICLATAIKRLVEEEQMVLGKVTQLAHAAVAPAFHQKSLLTLICGDIKGVLLEIRSALFPYEVINIIISYCGSR